jgi:hypothetical protein
MKPTKTASQPRIKGMFAKKPKIDRNEEILHGILDRLHGLEATLSKIENSVAVIRSGASFMQQLEKDAPKWKPKFGDRVMTSEGPGVYWKAANGVMWVVFERGFAHFYNTDQLTPIEP